MNIICTVHEYITCEILYDKNRQNISYYLFIDSNLPVYIPILPSLIHLSPPIISIYPHWSLLVDSMPILLFKNTIIVKVIISESEKLDCLVCPLPATMLAILSTLYSIDIIYYMYDHICDVSATEHGISLTCPVSNLCTVYVTQYAHHTSLSRIALHSISTN